MTAWERLFATSFLSSGTAWELINATRAAIVTQLGETIKEEPSFNIILNEGSYNIISVSSPTNIVVEEGSSNVINNSTTNNVVHNL